MAKAKTKLNTLLKTIDKFIDTYIFSLSQLLGSVSKMAIIAFGAMSTALLVMFTKLRFIEIREILQLFLCLKTLRIHRILSDLGGGKAHQPIRKACNCMLARGSGVGAS